MEKEVETLTPEVKFHLVRKIEGHKIVALEGPELLPHEEKYLEFHKVSGVILFERNAQSVSQLGELVSRVKEKLSSRGLDPLVMVDHEGDLVSELKKLIGIPPSAMAIAATGDTDLARTVAFETGGMMRKLGINTVLAPVADCYTNTSSPLTGLRCFGSDPDAVSAFISNTIKGFAEARVLSCVKHYPGHGSTPEDSHQKLPRSDKTLDELKREDLIPFAKAIRDGADMVMVSHIAFPGGKDAPIPASFDKRLVQELLRQELGFGGVVITDALEMEGARLYAQRRYGGMAGGFERAILAGVDLLLYTLPVPEKVFVGEDGESVMSLRVMETIIRTLERVVDRGRIEKKLEDAASRHKGLRNLLSILDVSDARIKELRRRATGNSLPPKETSRGKVIHLSDYPSVPGIYKTVAQRSMLLVRDPQKFVPVGRETSCLLLPVVYSPSGELKRQDLDGFLQVVQKHFPFWERAGTVVGFSPDSQGRARPVFSSEDGSTGSGERRALSSRIGTVIPVFSTRGDPPEDFIAGFEEFVVRRGSPLAIVTGWPIYEWLPEKVGVLITWGASPQAASIASALLCGEIASAGALSPIPKG